MERLQRGSGCRLSLIACPPGFGKTTLLASWREIDAEHRPVAWMTLDPADNDPVRLWAHTIEALRRVCPALARRSNRRLWARTPSSRSYSRGS